MNRNPSAKTVPTVAAVVVVAAVAFAGAVEAMRTGRLDRPPPDALAAPTGALETAGTAAARGDWAGVERAAARALARTPWLAPGWLYLGAAADARLGPNAALVFFDRAAAVDPYGPDALRVAVPPLLNAGWLDADAGAAALLRGPSAAIAAALPVTPPEHWAARFGATPRSEALEALDRTRHDAWLVALQRAPGAAELSPADRAWVLAGVCREDAAACGEALAACEARNDDCPRGVAIQRALIVAAADAATRRGKPKAAARWARELLPLRPARSEVQWVAGRLRAAGDVTAAVRLKRLHPAMLEAP